MTRNLWHVVLTSLMVALVHSSAGPIGGDRESSTGEMSKSTEPNDVSSSDWNSIRAAYEAGRHAAFAVEGGHQARNPGQEWLTGFDGRGFTTTPDAGTWTWGLELVGYGFAGQERAISRTARVNAVGGRVDYDWDQSLTEWFVNDSRGLEHGFTIRSRPDGDDGPLTLTLSVRGDLTPRLGSSGCDVAFVRKDGNPALNYSGLTVYDADRRAIPARFELVNEGLRLSIEESGAKYPLTIDPIAQQAYLKASNTEANDAFGWSVAVSGNTVVVGALYESSNATGVNGDQSNNLAIQSGAAYVFVRNGSTWSQQAYLKASNTNAFDYFGQAVAISGDSIVVGAAFSTGGEDSNATGVNGNQSDNSISGAGAAYVFVRSGTTWTQQAYLKASNTAFGQHFGISVGVSGDTILVGAVQENSNAIGVNGDQFNTGATASGAAYVFVRSGATWSQQAYLKASNTGSFDYFGASVSVSGNTAVVGAVFESSNATGVNGDQLNDASAQSGAAYVFVRSGTSWAQQAYVKASNTGATDEFGYALSISGDTLLVGAHFEDSSATGVNGDQSSNGTPNSGAAYVFVRSGATWGQQAYVKASNTGQGDQFGHSVSLSGNAAVVGAYIEASNATGVNGNQNDNSLGASGAAYAFVRGGTTWSQQAYLKASNTGSLDSFGHSVSISGDVVVIGADVESSSATGVNGDQSDNGASVSGAAYIFDLDNNPGTATYGTGTPGCAGTQTLGVNHAPMINSPKFAITCDNAPPSSLGLGIVADAQDLTGSDPFALGVLLHVNLFTATEVLTFDFVSDASGNGLTVNTGIPNSVALIGKTYYAMALWAWTSCSLPPFNLSTSRGLAITIQSP